jgi:hypothetical protein
VLLGSCLSLFIFNYILFLFCAFTKNIFSLYFVPSFCLSLSIRYCFSIIHYPLALVRISVRNFVSLTRSVNAFLFLSLSVSLSLDLSLAVTFTFDAVEGVERMGGGHFNPPPLSPPPAVLMRRHLIGFNRISSDKMTKQGDST